MMDKKTTEEIFQTISVLTDETLPEDGRELMEQLNGVETLVNEKLAELVEKTPYAGKYDLYERIRQYVVAIRLYAMEPEMMEKHVVGFYCSTAADFRALQSSLRTKYLKSGLLGRDGLDFSSDIPTILTHGSMADQVRVLSVSGRNVMLNAADYRALLRYSRKHRIDLSAVIPLLHMTSPNVNPNQAVVIFPKGVSRQSPYDRALFQSLDALVLDKADLGTSDSLRQSMGSSYLKTLIVKGGVPTGENRIPSGHFDMDCLSAVSMGEVYRLMGERLAKPFHNFYYQILFHDALSEILWFLGEEERNVSRRFRWINEDLVGDDANIGEVLRERKEELGRRMEELQKLCDAYLKLMDELDEQLRDIQQIFSILENGEEPNDHVLSDEDLLAFLYRSAAFQKVRPQSSQLPALRLLADLCRKYAHPAVTNLIEKDLMGQVPTHEELTALKNFVSANPFLTKLRIQYHKELGLTNHEMGSAAVSMTIPLSPFEHRMKGLYYAAKGEKRQAMESLYTALSKSDIPAGEELMKDFYGLSAEQKLELAEYGAGSLALDAGKRFLDAFQNTPYDMDLFKKAARFLNIAAATGQESAFCCLGDLWYQRGQSSSNPQEYWKLALLNYQKSALLNYQKSEKSAVVQERIGILQYRLQNYWEARTALSEANTALSHFLLGDMYENAKGVAADRDKAVQEYEKAAEQGHPDAQVRYERLNAEIEKEKQKTTVTENTYYGGSYYYSGYYSYYSGW